uniref:Uncharacterized protein n=1 Tax=Romanomermis culicivorax TaxID=13658 RepID=A0A915IFV0_ROMCU
MGPATGPNVSSFPPLDKTQDHWDTYLSQLNQHFKAHKVIDDGQRRAYFLSLVGTEIFELLSNIHGNEDISKEINGPQGLLCTTLDPSPQQLATVDAICQMHSKKRQRKRQWMDGDCKD